MGPRPPGPPATGLPLPARTTWPEAPHSATHGRRVQPGGHCPVMPVQGARWSLQRETKKQGEDGTADHSHTPREDAEREHMGPHLGRLSPQLPPPQRGQLRPHLSIPKGSGAPLLSQLTVPNSEQDPLCAPAGQARGQQEQSAEPPPVLALHTGPPANSAAPAPGGRDAPSPASLPSSCSAPASSRDQL